MVQLASPYLFKYALMHGSAIGQLKKICIKSSLPATPVALFTQKEHRSSIITAGFALYRPASLGPVASELLTNWKQNVRTLVGKK
jgi:hypothetical protein